MDMHSRKTCEPEAEKNPLDLERLYRAMIERSPLPTAATEGMHHVVRYANAAFCRLVGKEEEELLGDSFAQAMPEGQGSECESLLNRVFHTGQSENVLEQEVRQTPPTYWSYSAWAVLGAEQRPVGTVIQVTDATEAATFQRSVTAMNESLLQSGLRQHELREAAEDANQALKQSQEQLKALNEALEHRVAERTAEAQWRASQLQRLAAQMTQAEERERRRLSRVLHDHLQQMLVAAKIKLGSAVARAQDERATTAITEAVSLVDEAIAESRSLTKALSPAVLYDGGLAAGLEWLGRETGKKYHMPVAVQVAPEMEPDDLTTKVFVFHAARELILNAVKHAHASSLKVCLSRLGDDRLQIVIQDDGTGFDPEVMNRKESGGFGLFSIRERLDVIGGQLTITSSPLEGTKATIIARCRQSRQPERSDGAARDRSPLPPDVSPTLTCTDRIRVLLADDHPVLRKGLADMLTEHPHLNVLGEAMDGQEAMEMTLQLRPDVVLMDITMPRMDGIEATRQIKQAVPEVNVIGLSMHETDEMVAAMKSAGAGDYLSKTAPMEDLIAAILRACPRR